MWVLGRGTRRQRLVMVVVLVYKKVNHGERQPLSGNGSSLCCASFPSIEVISSVNPRNTAVNGWGKRRIEKRAVALPE